jgi:hypothetical protein
MVRGAIQHERSNVLNVASPDNGKRGARLEEGRLIATVSLERVGVGSDDAVPESATKLAEKILG